MAAIDEPPGQAESIPRLAGRKRGESPGHIGGDFFTALVIATTDQQKRFLEPPYAGRRENTVSE